MKKLAALMLAAAMTVCVASCASQEETPAGDDTGEGANKVTVWCWDDNFNVKAAQVAGEMYTAGHPDVQVEVVSMSLSDIRQKLNTALASGTYDGLPNVVLVEDYSIGGYLTAFPGEFADLSSFVDPTQWMDYKTAVMTDGDKIYGVPFDSGVTGMFYRTDYLENAGYTAEDLENITWDEFIEIGKAVTAANDGVSMMQITPGDLTPVKIMMQSAGSWYVQEDGTTLNIVGNEALKAAMSTYQKLMESGIVYQCAGWDDQVQAIQNGKLASVVDGCWIAATVKSAEDQSGKWALAPIPRMAEIEGSVNASNVGGASWYVLANVPGAETAMDYLKETFAGNAEFLNQMVEDINLVNTFKDSSGIDNYDVADPFFSDMKIYQLFGQWATEVPAVSYGNDTYAIDDIVEAGIQSVMQGADMDETIQSIADQAASLG